MNVRVMLRWVEYQDTVNNDEFMTSWSIASFVERSVATVHFVLQDEPHDNFLNKETRMTMKIAGHGR